MPARQLPCQNRRVIHLWLLSTFRDLAAGSGLPLHYVVLRPDEHAAPRRAIERRGTGALTDPGPVTPRSYCSCYSAGSARASVVLGIAVSSGVLMCRIGTGSGRLRPRLCIDMALRW